MVKNLLLAALVGATLVGCTSYKGAKIIEGTDFTLGIDIPVNGATTFKFDFVNYLSGFRVGVAEGAALKLTYTVEDNNEYFGVVKTQTKKTVNAGVEPREIGGAEGAGRAAEENPNNEGGNE